MQRYKPYIPRRWLCCSIKRRHMTYARCPGFYLNQAEIEEPAVRFEQLRTCILTVKEEEWHENWRLSLYDEIFASVRARVG